MSLPDYLADRVATALDPIPLDDGMPAPAPRHVAFYADQALRTAGDVAHTSNLLTGRFQLTYIVEGTDADRVGVQWMQRQARAVLIDHVPVVAGSVWGPIELETTLPAKPDPDSTTSAVCAIDTFVVRGATT